MGLLSKMGRNIKKRREALGYSQEELAERADLHRTYIGGVERGERNITIKSLSQIAEALNTKAHVLLTDNG
jgi:transcriptional regulator with XRE-family HTH domain